jgi:thiol-disulfide isomerase/thioredoxin
VPKHFSLTALLLAATLAGGAPAGSGPEKAGGIAWLTSYDDARAVAKQQGKPLLLDFSAEWCGWCKKLDSEVYTDARVAKTLGGFVCAKIDIDADPRVAMAYQVQSIPRIFVVNTYNEIVLDYAGFSPADELLPRLNEARDKGATKTGGNKAPEIAPPPPPPRSVIAQAAQSDSPDRLVALLADPDPDLRAAAQAAVEKLGESAVPILVKSLGSEYLGDRIASLAMLRKLGHTEPSFDPWAARDDRAKAIAVWTDWLNSRPANKSP